MQSLRSRYFIFLFTLVWTFYANISYAEDVAEKVVIIDNAPIRIATGIRGGTYNDVGNEICRFVNRAGLKENVRCEVVNTNGSTDNIDMLYNGDADFAIVQSDFIKKMMSDSSMAAKHNSLKLVATLHSEAFTILVRNDAEIRRIDDLRNKIVNAGEEGSDAEKAIDVIMRVKRWSNNSFAGVTNISKGMQIQALCSEKIDAVFMAVGHPNDYIKEAMNKCDLRILNLYDEDIRRFISLNNEYSFYTIPAELYRNEKSDVRLFGTRALLVTTSDAEKENVIKVAKAFSDNLSKIINSVPALKEMSENTSGATPQTTSMSTILPMHEALVNVKKNADIAKKNIVQNTDKAGSDMQNSQTLIVNQQQQLKQRAVTSQATSEMAQTSESNNKKMNTETTAVESVVAPPPVPPAPVLPGLPAFSKQKDEPVKKESDSMSAEEILKSIKVPQSE